MADRKITELTNITGANLADGDEFVVVDASADETKALTFAELKAGLDTATGFVRITGDTMTGDLITTGLTVNAGGDNLVAQFTSTDSLAYVSFSDDSTTSSTSVAVGANGDNFALYTGTSYGQERLRVTSGGSVGIGNSNPQHTLDFSTSATGHVIRVGDDNTTAYMSFSNPRGFVGFDGVTGAMRIQGGTTKHIIFASGDSTFGSGEKARITADGDFLLNQSTIIGANTSDGSDDQAVYLTGGGTQSVSRGGSVRVFGNEESNTGDVQIYSGNASTSNITLNAYGSNSTIQFTIDNGGEAMRVDSSRRVLVGKTSADNTTAGHRFDPSGYSSHVRDGNTLAIYNRLSSDGDIFLFRKDNTDIGKIGSADSGDRIYLGGKGTNRGVGIDSSASAFLPTTNLGGLNDGIMTLGTSTSRWSDVYASAATVNQYNNEEALPDVRPSLLLDFANSKTLDPRITFTRGSTATYWDGKTTHKAGENLFQYSQSHTNGYWDSSRHSATGGQTAPDGTSTAFKWTQYSTDTTAGYFGHLSFAYQVGTFTFSGFFKAGSDGGHVLLDERSGSGQKRTFFNLGTGAVGTSDASHTASIQDYGNGWYRCSITFTVSSGSTSQLLFYFASADNQATATIPINGEAGFSWGLQYEENDDVLTYIPTTSAPIVQYQPTLQTAVSGEARFDHDPMTGESKGLLIEESRTNLHLTSESATNHIGLNAMDVITNDAIAPDGTQSADFVYPTIGTQRHEIQPRWSSTSGVTYAFSAYIKAVGTVTQVSFSQTGGGNVTALFDLENGTVTNRGTQSGSYAEIKDAGNGWYRCILVGDASSSNSNYSMYISPSDDGETLGSGSTVFGSFAANGANGILIWGVQVEAGDFATSYVPTSGSTVTRSNDYAMISDLDLFERNKGFGTTLSVEGTARNNGLRGLLNFSAGNEVDFYGICETTGSVDGRLRASSTYDVINSTVTGLSAGEYFKSAMSINFLDKTSQTATNGTASSVDSSFQAQIPLRMTRLAIGTISSTTYLMNGHIKKAAVYPTAFNEATIKAMTKD